MSIYRHLVKQAEPSAEVKSPRHSLDSQNTVLRDLVGQATIWASQAWA